MTEAADRSTKEDDVGNLDAHGPPDGRTRTSQQGTSDRDPILRWRT